MIKDTIQFKIEYNFPVAQVWRALTQKEAMSEWLMPCNIEPQIGFKFQFQTKSFPGFDGTVNCEVLELIENKLLVFSWSGGPLKKTKVSFKLEDLGNKTLVIFEHSGFEGVLNKLIIKKILAHGWKSKILPILLLNYLRKNG